MGSEVVGGFLQGLSQARQHAKDRELIDEFKKTQVKALKANLDAKEKQLLAESKLASFFKESSAPQEGIEGPPQTPGPPMTVSQILSDPEGQLAALQSGRFSPKDIALESERQRFDKMFSGGGGLDLSNFTPGSVQQAAASRDISALKPITPVSKTIQGPEGPREQTYNPYTGELIADIGPSKEEKLPVGDAGKIKSIQFAMDEIGQAINMLAPGGVLNKKLVASLSSPIKIGAAREIDQLVNDAIATKVLVQSGVTAREDEVQRTKENFIPGILDLTTPGLAERKLKRLQEFMEGALDLTVLPPSLKKKVEEKRKKEGKSKTTRLPEGIPPGSRYIGTSGGKPVYETPEGKRLIVD